MRAVVVKTSAMGDIVQSLKVAQYLKCKQNVETVGWVVEESMKSLVTSCPYVDVVIPINSKKLKASLSPTSCIHEWCKQKEQVTNGDPWDIAFDLQGNVKSMLVNMCLKADKKIGYGWKSAPERVNVISTTDRVDPPYGLSTRDEYLWLVQSFFNDSKPYQPQEPTILKLTPEQEKLVLFELKRWPLRGETPVWIVASGSRWANKTCKPSTMLSLLEKAYNKLGGIFFVFVAGSYDELREVGYFASHFLSSSLVLFQPELPVLSHLLMEADRVIAMDSLILHLASLTDTPTFSFFGPSSADRYAPQRKQDGFFQGNCPFGVIFNKRCHILRTCPSGACLREAPLSTMEEELLNWNERVEKIVIEGRNQRIFRRGQLPRESSLHLPLESLQ